MASGFFSRFTPAEVISSHDVLSTSAPDSLSRAELAESFHSNKKRKRQDHPLVSTVNDGDYSLSEHSHDPLLQSIEQPSMTDDKLGAPNEKDRRS